jgi:ribokinase
VVGSVNVDLVMEVARLPVAGETLLGGTFRTAGGGKGANQAVAAARLGARVDLVACVGQDANGRQMRAALRAERIGLRDVRAVVEATGVAVILVERGGQNVIAVASGANACLTTQDVEHAAPRLARANTVVAQLEVPLQVVAAAASLARRSGAVVVLNAAPARTDLDEVLRLVDVLVVNETELAILSGSHAAALDEPAAGQELIVHGDEAAAARELLARGPRAVVVTLGARGAALVSSDGVTVVPPYTVEAVDTTAAGDAFVGALVAHLRGLDTLAEAARYAGAAAALACTRPGAQPSLPTAAEVDRLLAHG